MPPIAEAAYVSGVDRTTRGQCHGFHDAYSGSRGLDLGFYRAPPWALPHRLVSIFWLQGRNLGVAASMVVTSGVWIATVEWARVPPT